MWGTAISSAIWRPRTGDVRRARLERAVAEFDSASISTMHSFAAQVRQHIGLSAAIDPDARLMVSPDDLIDASLVRTPWPPPRPGVATPRTSRRWRSGRGDQGAHGRTRPAPGAGRLRTLGSRTLRPGPRAGRGCSEPARVPPDVRGDHGLRRRPPPAAPGPGGPRVPLPWSPPYRGATRSCSSTSSRTPTGSSGRSSPPCSARTGSDSALVLVGDPKQAIYRFRGADIWRLPRGGRP